MIRKQAEETGAAATDGASGSPIAKACMSGILMGGVPVGAYYLIKNMIADSRERKSLRAMQRAITAELDKDQVALSGDLMLDRYGTFARPPLKKKASGFNAEQLPLYAATAMGILAGGAGTALISKLVTPKQKDPIPGTMNYQNTLEAMTPRFALDYRDEQKRRYEEALKILRAVTDDTVMKDYQKTQSLSRGGSEKTAGVLSDDDDEPAQPSFLSRSFQRIRSCIPYYGYRPGHAYSDEDIERILQEMEEEDRLEELERAKQSKASAKKGKGCSSVKTAGLGALVKPYLYTAGILGGGYGVYRALRSMSRALDEQRALRRDKNTAFAAWLAQRQANGDAGKELTAYMDYDDSEEQETLKQVLDAYNTKYAPKPSKEDSDTDESDE